jgi:hypothetical protein
MSAPFEINLTARSIESEQSLIGGLLLDNSAYWKIAGLVTARSLHNDAHRRIFRHISRLIEAGHAADIVTVSSEIEKANEDEQTGGIAYLGEIANNTPSAANIRRYAEIVREKALERTALAAFEDFNSPGTGIPFAQRAGELSQTLAILAASGGGKQLPAARKFSEIAAAPRIQFDYALPGLRVGNVGVMAGYGGIGKGFLGLALAIDAALGGTGRLTGLQFGKPGKTVFVSIEDDQDALDSRLQAYSRHLNAADRATLDENLTVTSVWGKRGWRLLERGERNALGENVDTINAVVAAAKGARLLVLDTARKFFAFDENKSDEASMVLYVCDQIAQRAGCAVLLVHHLSKPVGDSKKEMPDIFSIRGSSALVADARWAAIFASPTEAFTQEKDLPAGRRYRVLDVGKVNHGGQPEMTLFEQDEFGALVSRQWPAGGQASVDLPPGAASTANNYGLRPIRRSQK